MTRHSRIGAVLRRIVRDEDGPAATEYAILLALLVLVAVAAIRGIGERVYFVYEKIASVMAEA